MGNSTAPRTAGPSFAQGHVHRTRKQRLIKLAVNVYTKSSQKGVWLTLMGVVLRLMDLCVYIYLSMTKDEDSSAIMFLFTAPVGKWPDKTRSPQTTGENLTERPTAEKQPFFGRWRNPHRPSSHRGLHCLKQLSDEVVNPGCTPSWTVGAERQLPRGVWRLFGSRSGGQPIRISPFPHVPDTWQFI